MGASLTRTLGLGHFHSILLFQDLDAILQPRSSCLTSACTPTLPPSPFPTHRTWQASHTTQAASSPHCGCLRMASDLISPFRNC